MKSLYLISLFLVTPLIAFPQNCDKCSRPRVALYDNSIILGNPENVDPGSVWIDLCWPAVISRSYMMVNDPQKDCIRWMKGALVDATDLSDSLHEFGSERFDMPPSGPRYSSDYLIWGSIVPQGGQYLLSMQLETAVSREKVKEVEILFDGTKKSTSVEAGRQAAIALMPIYKTIQAFEDNKRYHDVHVAISDYRETVTAPEITVKPEKTKVDEGETIRVDISMVDCDGVQLGNRQLFFMDTTVMINGVKFPLEGTRGGKVIPSVATTDESGNVTVQFIAGDSTDAAIIKAWYPHFKPSGKIGAFHGQSLLQIKDVPENLWLLEALFIRKYYLNRDTVKSSTFGGRSLVIKDSEIIDSRSIGQIIAVIENLAEDPEHEFFYNSTVDPRAISVSGAGFMDDYTINMDVMDGILLDIEPKARLFNRMGGLQQRHQQLQPGLFRRRDKRRRLLHNLNRFHLPCIMEP